MRSQGGVPTLLPELISRRLGAGSHLPAVNYAAHGLRQLQTWRQLDLRSRRAASGLCASSLDPGDRFAVVSRTHPVLVEALLAAARTATVAVFIDPRLSTEEMAYVLADADARLLMTGTEYVAELESVRNRLGSLSTTIIAGGRDDSYEVWLGCHEPAKSMYASAQQLATPQSDVLHLYPIGPAGQPKAVPYSHEDLLGEVPYEEPRPTAAVTGPAIAADIVPMVATTPLHMIDGVSALIQGLARGTETMLTA